MDEVTGSSEKEGERFQVPNRATKNVKKSWKKVKGVGMSGLKYQVWSSM